MIRAPNLDALGAVRHAFFTREGGVSEGVYASLNCGFSSGDEAERVAENRTIAMQHLGVAPSSLYTARQVHGVRVLAPSAPSPGPASVEADALVTGRRGITLGVLAADCAPVLIAEPEAGVIGAAHAGWRGALAGVVEALVEAMVELGAVRGRMVAAIGPCIAMRSYEVGPEFLGTFRREDPGSETLFEPVAGSDRLVFDLKAYVRRRLEGTGVTDHHALIDDTATDPTRFFSARRTRLEGGERFGLLLSAIALPD